MSEAGESYPRSSGLARLDEALSRAKEMHVCFDTFGIGPEATATPNALERIRTRTGGSFHPEPAAGNLACSLLTALVSG